MDELNNNNIEEFRQALQAFLQARGESPQANRLLRIIDQNNLYPILTDTEKMQSLGISAKTAEMLMLIPVLSRHIQRLNFPLPPTLHCMRHMREFLRYHYLGLYREHFLLLCFDEEGSVLSSKYFWKTSDAIPFSMRALLSEIDISKADAVLLACNVLNDVAVSDAEIHYVRALMDILRLKDIVFIDHILVGRNAEVSFRDIGYLSSAVQPPRAMNMPLYQNWLNTPE